MTRTPLVRSLVALLALSGCATPERGIYAPVPVRSTSMSVAMTSAPDFHFVGHRFDPAHHCTDEAWSLRGGPVRAEALFRAGRYAEQGGGAADTPALRSGTLSSGDLVQVSVAEGEMFSGGFVVDADGRIDVPHLPPIRAGGRSPAQVAVAVERMLVTEGHYHAHTARVDVALREHGEASISVGGSVFSPGIVAIATRGEGVRDETFDTARGADDWRRKLSGALKAAGGVRPDADVSRVLIRRNGALSTLDLSGVFTGATIDDPLIVDGDEIFVPSTECFSAALVRLSRITPPGIRVFMSNPTAPIYSNNSAAIDSYATRVPYGSRLLQGLASANCLGGARRVSATRYALVVGENRLSGQPEAMRVRVQDVIENPHRTDYNPYLQAGDAIACYDSTLINIRDFGMVASSILSPTALLLKLIGI